MSAREPLRGVLAVLLTLVVLPAMLTGCTAAEPAPLAVSSSADPVLRTAAAIYAGALTRAGLPATTRDTPAGDDAALLRDFDTGRVDLFPAYTGPLLAALTPEAPPADPAEVPATVARSLPAGAAIGDPVTGAVAGLGELIPVYRSAALDKAGLKALSRVAGDLTAAQLAALARRVADGADPRVVAADWLSGGS